MSALTRVSKLRRNRKGSVAVEFAIIAPLLVTLLAGMFEFAYVMTARATLQSVTLKAGRLIAATDCPDHREGILQDTVVDGMAHVASSDGLPPEIKARAFTNTANPEPFTDQAPLNSRYDVGESYDDVNDDGKWNPDMGQQGIGDAGQVVSYTTKYKVASISPYIASKFNGGTEFYQITATSVVRNEPIFRTTGCS